MLESTWKLKKYFFSLERNNCKKLGVQSPWLCFPLVSVTWPGLLIEGTGQSILIQFSPLERLERCERSLEIEWKKTEGLQTLLISNHLDQQCDNNTNNTPWQQKHHQEWPQLAMKHSPVSSRYGSLRNQSSLIRKSHFRKYWERQSCWLRLAAKRQALSQWQLMAAGLCVET